MSDTKLYIPIILGTARVNRYSEKVAKFILGEFSKRQNIETELIDVKDYIEARTVPPWEEHPKLEKWRQKAKRADGFIIVSPEYNHSFPGELKIFLDSAFGEYARKPASICGVSDGNFGGARMIEHLRQVFVTVKLLPVLSSLYFPNVDKAFEENGTIKDQGYFDRAASFFDELIWHAEALQAKREAN